QRRSEGGHAVIRVLTADDDMLLRLALHVPVATRELGGRIDGFTAARRQEDDGVADRRELHEALHELERWTGRVNPEVRIRSQPRHLRRGRLGDLAAAMA